MLALAERLEGDLEGPSGDRAHHMLEEQDGAALVVVEQREQGLVGGQHRRGERQHALRLAVHGQVLVGFLELLGSGADRVQQLLAALGRLQAQVLVDAVQQLTGREAAHEPAALELHQLVAHVIGVAGSHRGAGLSLGFS